MKRILVGATLLVLLTSCSITKTVPIKGEVVSCETIKLKSGQTPPLECLGGGAPISAEERWQRAGDWNRRRREESGRC